MWSTNVILYFLLIKIINGFTVERVVNGTDSSITRYPFTVSMRGATGSHKCGGSIIASRYILTAAHCVSGNKPDEINIQYATTDITTDIEQFNVVPIKNIIMHEKYNVQPEYANDIALLELHEDLVFNYKTLAPVTLPEPYYEIPQVAEGVKGVLVGWGKNETGGVSQTHLQEVDLKIYSDEECYLRHNNVTTVHQLCGGVDEGGKGQCSGDSGGPLLYNDNVQLGIVSWSIKPCAIYPYPGVYTKVSHYVDWIYKQIH
uniref:Peptidase S1 domain-containing protein n=1 Tax=Glossina brevipalpis TaxID=37001 RepID=A0A1A9WVH8_9MUSC